MRMQTLTAGMYAKYDRCLHGPRAELTQPPLSVAFLKKFLTIIKRRAGCAQAPLDPAWPHVSPACRLSSI